MNDHSPLVEREDQRSPNGRGTALAYAAVLAIPLFFLPNGTVYKGTQFVSAEVVPIGLLGGAVFLAIALVRNRLRQATNRFLGAVLLVAAYSFAVYAIRALSASTPSTPALWAVYTLPMLVGAFSGAELSRFMRPRELLFTLCAPVALVAMAHSLYSLATMGPVMTFVSFERGTHDVFGLFSIYQKVVYYPLILAFAFLFFAYHASILVAVVAGGFLLLDLVIVAAREPFAIMFVFALVTLVVQPCRRAFLVLLGILVVSGGLIIAALNFSSEARLLSKITKVVEGENTSDLTGGRSEVIRALSSEITRNPILGTGFALSEEYRGSGPTGFRLTPHNQYLEYALRGGVLYLLFAVGLLGITAVRGLQLATEDRHFGFVAAFFACLFLVAFNVNTAMRAPYSATVIWTLAGYVMMSRRGGQGDMTLAEQQVRMSPPNLVTAG